MAEGNFPSGGHLAGSFSGIGLDLFRLFCTILLMLAGNQAHSLSSNLSGRCSADLQFAKARSSVEIELC